MFTCGFICGKARRIDNTRERERDGKKGRVSEREGEKGR